MRNLTGNNGTFFRKTAAAGLVIPLLLLAVGLPSCATHRPHWSKVQAVAPKTKTEVQLYKDEAPRGNRKIKGFFYSATDDSLTLALKDGQRRTLQKLSVRKVLTHRPFAKRWPVWVVLGVTTLFGLGPENKWILQLMITLPATAGMVLAAPKMGGIYNVPPRERTRPAGDQQSAAEEKAPGKPEDPHSDE